MLSLVMLRDMNRSEQENLYRTSRKLSLVPMSGNHPHGNAFESDRRRNSCAKAFESPCEDLVLSVLKSPINHVGGDSKESNAFGTSPGSEVALCAETPDEDCRYSCIYLIYFFV